LRPSFVEGPSEPTIEIRAERARGPTSSTSGASSRTEDDQGGIPKPTTYWLELLVASALVPPAKLADLMRECDEITAIIVVSIRTAKTRRG
jgi:hypothetical protein